MADGDRGGRGNLRSDFLFGLVGASILVALDWTDILRHADYYRSEGLLWREGLWSLGFFVLYISFWMGCAVAGRWLRARFARKTEP